METEPGWTVCAESGNGAEAVELAVKHKPDIAILDLAMPQLNGLDAARRIKRDSPQTEIIIFTGEESEEIILQVFKTGARAYILKTDVQDHIFEAIRRAAEHKPYFTSKVGEVVFAKFLTGEKADPGSPRSDNRLSTREREVVQLVCEGLSNKEVAAKLGISIKTVETHRAAAMERLHLNAFSDLVRYAIRNKIIEA